MHVQVITLQMGDCGRYLFHPSSQDCLLPWLFHWKWRFSFLLVISNSDALCLIPFRTRIYILTAIMWASSNILSKCKLIICLFTIIRGCERIRHERAMLHQLTLDCLSVFQLLSASSSTASSSCPSSTRFWPAAFPSGSCWTWPRPTSLPSPPPPGELLWEIVVYFDVYTNYFRYAWLRRVNNMNTWLNCHWWHV